MKKNLYEKLGVPSNADDAAIKKAFRRKAQKSHPDREGGNKEEFQEVKHCYEVLSDPARRQRYDECGQESAIPEKESSAMAAIASMIIMVIDQSDHKHVDVIDAVKKQINNKINQCKTIKLKIKVDVEKFQDAAKRMKSKGGKPNAISAMIESQAQAGRIAMKINDDELSTLAEMLLILDEYQYEFTKQEGQQNPFGRSPGLQFFTTKF